MDETVLLLLQGGIVVPISHVTSNYSTSNIVIYDGSTYRDDPVDLLATDVAAVASNTIAETYIGSATVVAAGLSDLVAHVAPRYWGKQRTLWSFSRTISAVAAFTHVLWADLISGTCSHAPWRVGMTPSIAITYP